MQIVGVLVLDGRDAWLLLWRDSQIILSKLRSPHDEDRFDVPFEYKYVDGGCPLNFSGLVAPVGKLQAQLALCRGASQSLPTPPPYSPSLSYPWPVPGPWKHSSRP